MAQRQKRSISLPAELADAIERAAAADGTTVSGWLADTAAHRLRLDAGRRGIACAAKLDVLDRPLAAADD